MKDEDYIRKAVGLADSFYESGGMFTEDFICDWWNFNDVPKAILDALAAQLVRQVDALGFPVMVIASREATSIVQPDETYYNPGANVSGDRTMNTIKAIVDSKVLEND